MEQSQSEGLTGVLDAAKPMMDSMPVATLVADTDYNVVYANPAAVKLMDSLIPDVDRWKLESGAQALGKNALNFHMDPEHVKQVVEKVMPTEEGGHHSVQKVGPATFHYHLNAMRGSGGDVLGYIVQWDDLTEIVK